MEINLGWFQFASWKQGGYIGAGFWIRIFGRGFHASNGSLNFSERNGYTKFLRLPFGWRIKGLKRL